MKKKIISFLLVLLFTTQIFSAQRETSYYEFIRLESDQPLTSRVRSGDLSPEREAFVRGERRLRPLLSLLNQDIPFDFIFSGYVKNATFWDTRQVFGVADNYVLFLPKDRLCDACGNDINAAGQFNMLPIETRVIANIFGPKIGSAYSGARISGDFFSVPSGTILVEPLDAFNRFTMRHAYFKLMWPEWSLIAGQTWHPMMFPITSPDTVSFNTGLPFALFARVAQIRATYHHEHVELVTAMLSQTFFVSLGPRGLTGQYFRNSLTPEFVFHGTVFLGRHMIGAGINYKRLVPRLVTNKNIKTNTAIGSIIAVAHVELHFDRFDWYVKGMYAQNGTNFGVLGGYAVHSINPCNDKREYTNLNTASIWTEMIVRTTPIEPAIFIAYAKTLGAHNIIIQSTLDANNKEESTVYAFFPKVDYAWRISPRIRWVYKAFEVAAELEYTRAAYGDIGPKGKVINTQPPVDNFRFLLTLTYYY